MVRITLKLFFPYYFLFTDVLGNHVWVNFFTGGSFRDVLNRQNDALAVLEKQLLSSRFICMWKGIFS